MRIHTQVTTSYPVMMPLMGVLEDFFSAYTRREHLLEIDVSLNPANGLVTLNVRADLLGQDDEAELLAQELAPFALGPSAVVIEAAGAEENNEDLDAPYRPARKFVVVPNGHVPYLH
jgi:hypothetical protein